MEYCHFSMTEAWALPVPYRKWFVERKEKENKKIAEARKKQKSSSPAPSPRKPAGK